MKSPTESDAPRNGDHEDPSCDSGVPPFIEAGAFDFLPKSADPVTEVPDIVAEVEPGDPLTERLEAILSHSAGPDVELRTLFEETPWFMRIGDLHFSCLQLHFKYRKYDHLNASIFLGYNNLIY